MIPKGMEIRMDRIRAVVARRAVLGNRSRIV
jgi:hypothetical protein